MEARMVAEGMVVVNLVVQVDTAAAALAVVVKAVAKEEVKAAAKGVGRA